MSEHWWSVNSHLKFGDSGQIDILGLFSSYVGKIHKNWFLV